METYVRAKEGPGTIIWAFQLPYEGKSGIPFTEESPVYTCDGGYKMSFAISRSSNPILMSLFARMSAGKSGCFQHYFPAEFHCVITSVNPEDSADFVEYSECIQVDGYETKDIKIVDLSSVHYKNGMVLLKIRLTLVNQGFFLRV